MVVRNDVGGTKRVWNPVTRNHRESGASVSAESTGGSAGSLRSVRRVCNKLVVVDSGFADGVPRPSGQGCAARKISL